MTSTSTQHLWEQQNQLLRSREGPGVLSYREGFAHSWNISYASPSWMLNASLSLTKNTWESYIYERFCHKRAWREWSLPACLQAPVSNREWPNLSGFQWKASCSTGSHWDTSGVTGSRLPVKHSSLWDPPKVCLSKEMAKLLMSTPFFQRNTGSRQWLDEGIGVYACSLLKLTVPKGNYFCITTKKKPKQILKHILGSQGVHESFSSLMAAGGK